MLSSSWTCGCTVHAHGQGQLLYLYLRSISSFSYSQLPFQLFPLFFYCVNFPLYWIISISMHICCYFFHLKKKTPFCFTSSFIYYPVYLLFFTPNGCLYSFSSVLPFPFFCIPLPLHQHHSCHIYNAICVAQPKDLTHERHLTQQSMTS